MSDIFSQYRTPFEALKTAEQSVQFALDPSKGLTRERYHWFSNGERFNSANFANGTGEIDIQTSASASDIARLKSGLAGQYVSQSLAKPGIKLFVDDSNIEIENGRISLTHGEAYFGPFEHNGTEVLYGFGVKIDSDGAYAFWKSDGEHQGNSPVPQEEWNSDSLDGNGNSGLVYDPSDGYVFNFPYTWYNNGQLAISLLDAAENELVTGHSFNPPEISQGRASLETPNLPVQVVVDNAGTAEPLTAAVGGMQYTLYGAESTSQSRDSYMAASGKTIDAQVSDPIDPTVESGPPLYALKRDPLYDSVELKLTNIDIEPDGDIYVYVWDTWDESTLTGASFERTFSNFDTETRAMVDRSASAFDQSNAVFRKMIPVSSGGGSKIELASLDVDERIPLDAIRVVTAVGQDGSNISADYVMKNIEGF